MARRLGFKKSLRDTLAANRRALEFMSPTGTLRPEDAAGFDAAMPKQRKTSGVRRDLEGPVVAAISELLAVHPRVIWAARFNSGMASYEAKSGRFAPVWFHKFVRMPEPMRMPDFMGIVADDLGYHNLDFIIAIEAKAPGWTKPRDDREREQAAFLAMIRGAGGIGIFATSAEEVAAALK